MPSCFAIREDAERKSRVNIPDSNGHDDDRTPSARLAVALRNEVVEGIKESIDDWMGSQFTTQQEHVDKRFTDLWGQYEALFKRQEGTLEALLEAVRDQEKRQPRTSFVQRQEEMIGHLSKKVNRHEDMLAANVAMAAVSKAANVASTVAFADLSADMQMVEMTAEDPVPEHSSDKPQIKKQESNIVAAAAHAGSMMKSLKKKKKKKKKMNVPDNTTVKDTPAKHASPGSEHSPRSPKLPGSPGSPTTGERCRRTPSIFGVTDVLSNNPMERMIKRDAVSAQERVDDAIENWPLSPAVREVIRRTDGPLSGLVRSQAFMGLTNALIFGNVIFICVQSQHAVDVALTGEEEADAIGTIDLLFSLSFAMELIARLIGERVSLFICAEWRWNMMDSMFVLLDVINLLVRTLMMGSADVSYISNLRGVIRGLRLLRAARTIRLFRTVKFIGQIRLILSAMVTSASLATYAVMILGVVLLFFAIVFMQAAAIGIAGRDSSSAASVTLVEKLLELFGTVSDAEISLFMVVSGGVEWATVYNILVETSKGYSYIFLLFIFYIIFGCANVFVAVFVESIFSMKTKFELEESHEACMAAMKVLQNLETEQEGYFSLDELQIHLKSPQVQEQFGQLGLDTFETIAICDVVTDGGKNTAKMEDLAQYFVRFTRSVRSADFVPLHLQNRRFDVELDRLSQQLDKGIQSIMHFVQQGFQAMAQVRMARGD